MEKEPTSANVRGGQENSEDTADLIHKVSEDARSRVKFEVFGEEMIEKTVKLSGNSGRVYLPPNWVEHDVKIIRIN